jgi:hypothetical protein
MPIQNLGIEPFVQGVSAGNQLQALAMQLEAARIAREEAAYKMGKERDQDAALRQVMSQISNPSVRSVSPELQSKINSGMAGPPEEGMASTPVQSSYQDVMSILSKAGQQSPEAALKAYEIAKVLVPSVREQAVKELLTQKILESKLKTQEAINTELGKEQSTLPIWAKKKDYEHGLGIERDASGHLMSYMSQAELEKLKASLKPDEKPIEKTIKDLDGNEVQTFYDPHNPDKTLYTKHLSKDGKLVTEYDMKNYVPYSLGGESNWNKMQEYQKSLDPSVTPEKILQNAQTMIENNTVIPFMVDQTVKAKQLKQSTPNPVPTQLAPQSGIVQPKPFQQSPTPAQSSSIGWGNTKPNLSGTLTGDFQNKTSPGSFLNALVSQPSSLTIPPNAGLQMTSNPYQPTSEGANVIARVDPFANIRDKEELSPQDLQANPGLGAPDVSKLLPALRDLWMKKQDAFASPYLGQ